MIRKHAHNLLLFFVVAGMLVSLWSLKHHYDEIGGSACNVSRTFNCDVVNKGIYSEIAGFPVAGIGVVGYLVLGLIAVFQKKDDDPTLAKVLFLTALGALAFTAYLTYIEARVLATWCLLCLASASCVVGVTATSGMRLQTVKVIEETKKPLA